MRYMVLLLIFVMACDSSSEENILLGTWDGDIDGAGVTLIVTSETPVRGSAIIQGNTDGVSFDLAGSYSDPVAVLLVNLTSSPITIVRFEGRVSGSIMTGSWRSERADTLDIRATFRRR